MVVSFDANWFLKNNLITLFLWMIKFNLGDVYNIAWSGHQSNWLLAGETNPPIICSPQIKSVIKFHSCRGSITLWLKPVLISGTAAGLVGWNVEAAKVVPYQGHTRWLSLCQLVLTHICPVVCPGWHSKGFCSPSKVVLNQLSPPRWKTRAASTGQWWWTSFYQSQRRWCFTRIQGIIS